MAGVTAAQLRQHLPNIKLKVVWCKTAVNSLLMYRSYSSLALSPWGLVTPYGDNDLGTTLAQVMACYLTAPSHYLNQCWLITTKVYWHSSKDNSTTDTVYPKKYAHGFCFAVLCCGYTLTDFPISIRLTSLALWRSNDCPRASKATLMNMDKYFMSIHYERLHNHNKAKHNETVCIFLGIYCTSGISHQN